MGSAGGNDARATEPLAQQLHTTTEPRPVTLQTVFQLKAAEKAAADAFWAQHAAEAKPGKKPSATYFKLQSAMITATKARQAAMTAYAATL